MQTSEQTEWLMLHPSMVILELARSLRSTLFGLVLGGYFALKGNMGLLTMIIFFSIILPTIGIVLRFVSYRYGFGVGHILIKEGILSKKQRVIPVTRIHNINTTQSLVARLFGVVRVDLETAGGGQAEATLPAITQLAANTIDDFISQGKKSDTEARDTDVEPDTSSHLVYQASNLDLILLGITTNRIGLIFAGLYAMAEVYEQDIWRMVENWMQRVSELSNQIQDRSGLQVFLVVVISVALIMTVSWAISITLAIIQYYGFTLSKVASDLKIRAGLFTVRSYTIPAGKIQALRFKTSAIRRPFKLLQINVQSAGHMGVQERNQNSAIQPSLLAPLTNRKHIDLFVNAVWPDAIWSSIEWLAVHRYTRTRQFRVLWLVASAGIVALIWKSEPHWAQSLSIWLIAGILSWLIAHLTYKQTGYAVDERFVYLKTGFIGLQSWVIPVNRIQMLELRQSPFQRRRRLVSLVIDVAGSGRDRAAVIPNIELENGWRLFNRFGSPSAQKN